MFSVTGSVMSHMKSGKLRAPAVTSAQPSKLVPGLPTVAASGVPGFDQDWRPSHSAIRPVRPLTPYLR